MKISEMSQGTLELLLMLSVFLFLVMTIGFSFGVHKYIEESHRTLRHNASLKCTEAYPSKANNNKQK